MSELNKYCVRFLRCTPYVFNVEAKDADEALRICENLRKRDVECDFMFDTYWLPCVIDDNGNLDQEKLAIMDHRENVEYNKELMSRRAELKEEIEKTFPIKDPT